MAEQRKQKDTGRCHQMGQDAEALLSCMTKGEAEMTISSQFFDTVAAVAMNLI
jgi:hypothetical protein